MNVRDFFKEHEEVLRNTLNLANKIEEVAKEIKKRLKEGKKVLICGNGGSAADAQHFAAELIGRFKKERKSLAGIALTTDTSILTAIGNDYSFEEIFSRQVEGLGNSGDVLFLISTSGNSPNLIRAAEKGKEKNLFIIGLLGKGGGKLKELCDMSIIIDSNNTPRIQEMHIFIIHIICELIEDDK